MLAAYCFLCCVILCSSHMPLRPSRARRRNNTGFYYGLRDDDMNFNRNSKRSHRWNVLNNVAANLSLGGAEYLADDWHERFDPFNQVQSPGQSLFHSNQDSNSVDHPRLLQRISHTFMRPLVSMLPRQLIINSGMHRSPILQSILNMPKLQSTYVHNNNAIVQAAVKSKSKKQSSSKKRRKNNTGFYYGIREDVVIFPERSRGDTAPQKQPEVPNSKQNGSSQNSLESSDVSKNNAQTKTQEKPSKKRPQLPRSRTEAKTKKKNKVPSLPKIKASESGIFEETLEELRAMKEEIIELRKELRSVKGQLNEKDESQIVSDETANEIENPKWWTRQPTKEPGIETPGSTLDDEAVSLLPLEHAEEEEHATKLSPRLRRREFEQIGRNVETWACSLLFDKENKEEDGWKEIECNKFCRKKFNPDGRTQVYLKVSLLIDLFDLFSSCRRNGLFSLTCFPYSGCLILVMTMVTLQIILKTKHQGKNKISPVSSVTPP